MISDIVNNVWLHPGPDTASKLSPLNSHFVYMSCYSCSDQPLSDNGDDQSSRHPLHSYRTTFAKRAFKKRCTVNMELTIISYY